MENRTPRRQTYLPSQPKWHHTNPPHHVYLEDEDTYILAIPFEFTWQATWLLEDIVKSLPNGNSEIYKYMLSKPSLHKKTMSTPPTPPPRPCGWHPQHTIYTTHPINPGLGVVPVGSFVITSHPKSRDMVLLHAPDIRFISPILKYILHKLTMMYRP